MSAPRQGKVPIFHAAVQALESRMLLTAQLVKDLGSAALPSDPQNLVDVGGRLYFTIRFQDELWTSDGTVEGTVLLTDALGEMSDLVEMNGRLFFVANDFSTGQELWVSDGTVAGTVMVKDIHPFTQYTCPPSGYGCYTRYGSSDPRSLTEVNGTLYFSADDGASGRELWKSDGTEAGTTRVRDINPGTGTSEPRDLLNVGGTLYFSADDGVSGRELWKSDGTDVGTVRVKDVNTGAGSLSPSNLTSVDGTLFFAANDGLSGNELWKSDGTEAGTVQVKDINPGTAYNPDCEYGFCPEFPKSSSPSDLTDVGGTLFFSASRTDTGRELWKSDGTAAGTVLVKDINPVAFDDYGTLRGLDSDPSELTVVDGTIFFTADDGAGGRELWKSDGTEAGTVLVKDIHPGRGPEYCDAQYGCYPGPAYSSSPSSFAVANGTLYFTANDDAKGPELWKTDGTSGGTARVRDISPGPRGSDPRNLASVNGTLFFTADDGAHERELWVTTASSLANDGVLSLAGTDEDDAINFGVNGLNLQVQHNGQLQMFPLADVNRIEIQALAGADLIDYSDISIPTDLDAGTGNDQVTAGAASDTVSGSDGDDTISGGAGPDRITGGDGNDFLSGNADGDKIDGGLGADLLVGNGGNDRLRGQEGRDRLYGRDGRDRLAGGGGHDLIFGGAAGDFLSGQGGDDQLFGEGGNDRLTGNAGRDILHGNAGDDHLISNDGSIDELFGDGGDDFAAADVDDILVSTERTV